MDGDLDGRDVGHDCDGDGDGDGGHDGRDVGGGSDGDGGAQGKVKLYAKMLTL